MSSPPPQPPRPPGPPPPPRPTGPPKQAEEMYPVSELAAMWRCSTDHIYRLIATKKLRSVQLGIGRAKTRIPESAAADYIKANTRRAA